jgi:hypothetical protein
MDIFDLMDFILEVLRLLLFVMWGGAIVLFFWGLAKFVFRIGPSDRGADEAREAGKHLMIWGIIAFFVLVSLWGLVGFLLESIGVDSSTSGALPFVDKNGMTVTP